MRNTALLAMALGFTPLLGQDAIPALHVGLAEGNSSLHRMVGASVAVGFAPHHELRVRLDTSVGSATAHGTSRLDSKVESAVIEWIWHKKGVRSSGFLLGAGLGSDRYIWASRDWTGIRTRQTDSPGGPHLIIGGGIGGHLRLEARLRLGQKVITSETDAQVPSLMLMLSAGWIF